MDLFSMLNQNISQTTTQKDMVNPTNTSQFQLSMSEQDNG